MISLKHISLFFLLIILAIPATATSRKPIHRAVCLHPNADGNEVGSGLVSFTDDMPRFALNVCAVLPACADGKCVACMRDQGGVGVWQKGSECVQVVYRLGNKGIPGK